MLGQQSDSHFRFVGERRCCGDCSGERTDAVPSSPHLAKAAKGGGQTVAPTGTKIAQPACQQVQVEFGFPANVPAFQNQPL